LCGIVSYFNMGCTSSKPKATPPAASAPSSVTPSAKQSGNEKTVRFADESTEISESRPFDDNKAKDSTPSHSISVLKDVVAEGKSNNSNNNHQTVPTEVHVLPVADHKAEEPPVVHHSKSEPEPIVVKHVEPPIVHHQAPEPEPVVEVTHHATAVATLEEPTVHHHATHSAEPEPVPVPEPAATVVHHTQEHHVEPTHVDPQHHDEPVVNSTITTEPEVHSHITSGKEPTEAFKEAATEAITEAAAAVLAVPSKEEERGVKIPDKKKGYILKQGHVIKNWKNRFFILDEGVLTYYESSTPNAPYGVNKKGELKLNDITVTDNKSLVTLSTRGRGAADLVLEIKYPNEREEWVAAIRQHVDYLKAAAAAATTTTNGRN